MGFGLSKTKLLVRVHYWQTACLQKCKIEKNTSLQKYKIEKKQNSTLKNYGMEWPFWATIHNNAWSYIHTTNYYRIAGNFRMVLIFIYFVCSIPYTQTVKIWTYEILFLFLSRVTFDLYAYHSHTWSLVAGAKCKAIAHWTMSFYRFFAKASKQSDLSGPSGPLSTSITIKEASDASVTAYCM